MPPKKKATIVCPWCNQTNDAVQWLCMTCMRLFVQDYEGEEFERLSREKITLAHGQQTEQKISQDCDDSAFFQCLVGLVGDKDQPITCSPCTHYSQTCVDLRGKYVF